MHIVLMTVILLSTNIFIEWHAKYVFVYTGYPRRYGHGKSGNRAKKHYKNTWNVWQRLLWIPLFKEKYETKYMVMAYLSYANTLFTVITLITFYQSCYISKDGTPSRAWVYLFIAWFVFWYVRFMYSNAIGKRQI